MTKEVCCCLVVTADVHTDFIFAFQIKKLYLGIISYEERSLLLHGSYNEPVIRRVEMLCRSV